jgi:23S rRNA (uracil1939-C5)-methyltransferase
MAFDLGLSFCHPKEQKGYMRNVIIRNNQVGDWMVILIIGDEDTSPAIQILDALCDKFPEIKSSFWVVNTKMNDTIYDLETHQHRGAAFLTEGIDQLTFRVRPKSFFQPNGQQAGKLYHFALEMAQIKPTDVVYDLYCGTGTLSLLAAKKSAKVVGIESVPQAINDANENAQQNGITNCHFEVGDMRFLFNNDLLNKYGPPDVVITDPPRSGMHEDVIRQLMEVGADRIVYVSCNPATQARDIQMMETTYEVAAIQPVDMFPHTHHVENVVLLCKR